jgi:cell wall-associated NlpC family hydrolase
MFGAEIDAAARAHALADYPRESCGLVVAGRYVPVMNVAADPEAQFAMPDDAWIAHGDVQAVIHSHGAAHALAPSASDMTHQIASAVPWGITRCDGVAASPLLWWGDFRLDEPLLGRSFVHGVTDCYGAIRAWFWQQRGVRLIDVARDDQWWQAGGDLYSEGFARAGFRVVPATEANDGDVVLIAFRSKVPNHGGVLVDGGLIYHHLQGRLSAREPFGRWRQMAALYLRYEG